MTCEMHYSSWLLPAKLRASAQSNWLSGFSYCRLCRPTLLALQK